MKATPALRIRLLGEPDLRLDGLPLSPLESARAASLLAYLLLHRKAPQSRQRLASPLWPDSTEPLARADRAPDDGLAALREAVELYRGDLLEGGQYEWLLDERDQLRQRWLRAWSGWRRCWPRAATTPRRSPAPSSCCGPTRCTSGPTAS